METDPQYRVCKDEITSVAEYLSCIEHFKQRAEKAGKKEDFLFRGQNADEPLIPNIARIKNVKDLLNREQLVMAEFARTNPPFVRNGYDDAWDRIALAQHFGLPTRLLDWTYSAMSALWFAVSQEPKDAESGEPGIGVVWIMKPKRTDFIKFPTEQSPFEVTRTRIFTPRVVSERISAQAGLFTVHAAVQAHDGPFIPLADHKHFSAKLIKLRIPHEHFNSLRIQLHQCGVNSATVFPDMVGLCRHLRWRYFENGIGIRAHPMKLPKIK